MVNQVKQEMTARSTGYSQSIDAQVEKLQKTSNITKAAPNIERSDEEASTDAEVTTKFIGNLFNGKSNRQALNDLSKFSTKSLDEFTKKKGANKKAQRLANKIIKDRNKAAKSLQAGTPEVSQAPIDVAKVIKENKGKVISTIKDRLSRRTIATTEEARSILGLIDASEAKGYLTKNQANILRKRLANTAKDAQPKNKPSPKEEAKESKTEESQPEAETTEEETKEETSDKDSTIETDEDTTKDSVEITEEIDGFDEEAQQYIARELGVRPEELSEISSEQVAAIQQMIDDGVLKCDA